jgi:hypothetical protein
LQGSINPTFHCIIRFNGERGSRGYKSGVRRLPSLPPSSKRRLSSSVSTSCSTDQSTPKEEYEDDVGCSSREEEDHVVKAVIDKLDTDLKLEEAFDDNDDNEEEEDEEDCGYRYRMA